MAPAPPALGAVVVHAANSTDMKLQLDDGRTSHLLAQEGAAYTYIYIYGTVFFRNESKLQFSVLLRIGIGKFTKTRSGECLV